MRAGCRGGAVAWVTGVLGAPGTQGELAASAAGNIVLRSIWQLAKYSVLEAYWPIHSSILAWRTPLKEKTGRPQSTELQRFGQE